MSKTAHLAALKQKHHAIDQKISKSYGSPAFDDLELNSLKKQKLALKQEIELLESSINE